MSFRLKTIIGIAAIEAVTLGLLIWTSLDFLQTSNETSLAERAATTGALFATMTTDAVIATDIASLESLVDELLKNPGVVYGSVFSSEFGLLAQGGPPEPLTRPFKPDTRVGDVDDGVFDHRRPIMIDGVVYGHVEIGLGISAFEAVMSSARKRVFALAGAEMLLTAVFSLLLGYLLTRQLDDLSRGASAISSGRMGLQIPVRGTDELARAAMVFNRMSGDLEKSYAELNAALADSRNKERRLAVSEARMRAIVENAVDGIVTIDDAGIVESINPAAERIFGYALEEVKGRNVNLFIPEPHRSRHDRYIRNYIETGHAKIIGIGREVAGRRKDGRVFPVELGISEINVADQRLFTGIVRDISERKRIEAELRRHQNHLEQLVASRTRELEDAQEELIGKAFESGRAQLAAMVLHNIGNAVVPLQAQMDDMARHMPVQAIAYLQQCFADLTARRRDLAAYVNEDPRGRQVFDFFGELIGSFDQYKYACTLNLKKMTESIAYISEILILQRGLAHEEAEVRERADLNALIEKTLQMLIQSLKKRGIRVKKTMPGPATILIDKSRMMQVLVNLIKNAYEAIDQHPGAPIKKISIRTGRMGDRIVSTIADTGVGLNPEEIPTLFAFGKSMKGSTGFGLHYCKMFVEKNAGTLSIESNGLHQGAVVRISLPAYADDARTGQEVSG